MPKKVQACLVLVNRLMLKPSMIGHQELSEFVVAGDIIYAKLTV